MLSRQNTFFKSKRLAVEHPKPSGHLQKTKKKTTNLCVWTSTSGIWYSVIIQSLAAFSDLHGANSLNTSGLLKLCQRRCCLLQLSFGFKKKKPPMLLFIILIFTCTFIFLTLFYYGGNFIENVWFNILCVFFLMFSMPFCTTLCVEREWCHAKYINLPRLVWRDTLGVHRGFALCFQCVFPLDAALCTEGHFNGKWEDACRLLDSGVLGKRKKEMTQNLNTGAKCNNLVSSDTQPLQTT